VIAKKTGAKTKAGVGISKQGKAKRSPKKRGKGKEFVAEGILQEAAYRSGDEGRRRRTDRRE